MQVSEEARLASFMQQGQVWPYHGTELSAERLAKGGFVFLPTQRFPDLVACVRCGGKLQGFKVTDNPEQDHAKHYPDCHLSQKKHDEEARTRYTRDKLSDMEQRYFDGLKESKNPAKAQVVLNKIGLCHQAGIRMYETITAFVEGRLTFEALHSDQAEMEMRLKQCERQQAREERQQAREEAQERKARLSGR